MKHILISALAGFGLLLMTLPASAQYLPRRDYHQVQYANQQTPLSAIQGTLTANGVSQNAMRSADQWNYFASETFPGFTPPAPESLFPWLANTPSTVNAYTNASHDPVSFTTWWNAIQPYLTAAGY
ncbi:MAG TPA: hypothetical protein VME43_01225 [Bryobacteraceae bacterium]|nr:hypothetical protein [Bryobacteraceae bacterium]